MLTQQYQKLRLRSKDNLKRHVLQIIPVLSIFALLGNLLMCGQTYAATGCMSNVNAPDGYMYIATGCGTMKIPPTPTEHSSVGSNTASSSMLIDNGVIRDTILAKYGETNYATHIVSIKANDIDDYALTLSSEGITGPSAISGTNMATGANLDNDSWGYSWSSNLDTRVEDLTYQAVGANTKLTGDSVVDNSVDFSRRIAFATKFTNADPGTYTARVVLSLTLTPKQVAGGTYVGWNDMVYLQDMSPQACASVPIGTTKKLLDYRTVYLAQSEGVENVGKKEYTIKKLNDGNCWMIDNLAIDLSRVGVAMKDYSDNLSVDYPATSLANRFDTATTNKWESDSIKEQFSKAPALVSSSRPGDGNGYQPEYGYYYSWCAATAGCKKTSGANPIRNENAVGSICPKGWQLPNDKSNSYAENDFISLMQNTNYNGWNGSEKVTTSIFPEADFTDNSIVVTELRTTDVKPATFYLGGADWYRAGYVDANGLNNPGADADYSSRTASSGMEAYNLYLYGNGNLRPANHSNRFYGLSVRCVAYSS